MKEFKKMLKKDKHHIIKEQNYGNIYNIIFIISMIALMILQFKKILPSYIALIYIIILFIPAIFIWILEIKREKNIKLMYKNYQDKKKILKVEDNIKVIKILLIIEVLSVLTISSFVIYKNVYNQNGFKEYVDTFVIKTKDGEEIETEWYDFDNNNFSLKVPKSFVALDEELINKKYPNENPPSYVLSNDKTNINIAVNRTDNDIKNSQIKSYINILKEQLSKVGEIKDVRFFERDGHEVGEIKFITKAVDTDIYNHMIAFSDGDKLRILSFNCTKELQENWKDVGEFIMNSITFK